MKTEGKVKHNKCYNCKHAGQQFKVVGKTHLHCEHPKYKKEDFDSGKFSPWDTLQEFWNTCEDFEPKTDNMKTTLDPEMEKQILKFVSAAENKMKFLPQIIGEFAQQHAHQALEEELDIIWETFDKEGMHGSQNYILSRINKLKEKY